MRDYVNDTRCRMLTQLVERNVTGLELIRAFERAPNLIEEMYMNNSNRHNDDFIAQLVNVTHRSVIEPLHRCESTAERSPVIKTKPKPSLQRSPLSSPAKVNKHLSSSTSIHSSPTPKITSNPSPPPKHIISSSSIPFYTPEPSPPITPPPSPRSSLPRLSSHHSSDEQTFSMGYQWKGEDN